MNKAKDFLLKISTESISKNEAQELYNNLIKPDVGALKKSKGRSKNIRLNILNILENIKSSLFEGYYSNCKDLFEESNETDMPELESEESAAKRNIASRAKLRRKILNTIKEKKNNNNELFSHYFNYSSPSNMLSKLSYASDEGNKN